MPRLTVHDVDQRVADLRAVLDRASASLLELDADVTRQLLEQSTVLRGATAEAWRDAAARHAGLWSNQLAIEKVFVRMTEQRGTRKAPSQGVLVCVDELLTGDWVEVPRDPERDRPSLTGSEGAMSRCSIEAALERMNGDYETVSACLTKVANVWADCTDRLERLDKEVSELVVRVQDLGMRPTNQLRSIEDSVADAHGLAREDPLSFDPQSVVVLEERVVRARVTVDQAVRGREVRTEQLADADQVVQACLAAVHAGQAELDAMAEKVVVREDARATVDALANEIVQLRTEQENAAEMGNHLASGRIRLRGEGIQRELGHLLEEERTRAGRRDELRGLLGAYLAKAQAAGLAENLDVDEAYVAALDELYVAPCDLERSERLVSEFGSVISASGDAQ